MGGYRQNVSKSGEFWQNLSVSASEIEQLLYILPAFKLVPLIKSLKYERTLANKHLDDTISVHSPCSGVGKSPEWKGLVTPSGRG